MFGRWTSSRFTKIFHCTSVFTITRSTSGIFRYSCNFQRFQIYFDLNRHRFSFETSTPREEFSLFVSFSGKIKSPSEWPRKCTEGNGWGNGCHSSELCRVHSSARFSSESRSQKHFAKIGSEVEQLSFWNDRKPLLSISSVTTSIKLSAAAGWNRCGNLLWRVLTFKTVLTVQCCNKASIE